MMGIDGTGRAARSLSLILAAAGCLMFAPAAGAATEFTFGPGEDPDIAVDSAGTAHVAWQDTSRPVGQDVVLYCRIRAGRGPARTRRRSSRGASARCRTCSCRLRARSLWSWAMSRAPTLPGSAHLSGCRDRWRLLSGGEDGGYPDALYAGPQGQAIAGPAAGTISWVNDGNPDVNFTNASLTGAAATDFANLESGAGGADAPVGLYGDQAGGGLNPCQRIGEALAVIRRHGQHELRDELDGRAGHRAERSFEVTLAAGPAGCSSSTNMDRRRRTRGEEVHGQRLDAGAPVSEVGSLLFPDMSQDASGRLHALYINNNGDYLQWRTSTNGVNWSAPVTINVERRYFRRRAWPRRPTGRDSPPGTRASVPTGLSASCGRCRSSAGTSRRAPPSRSSAGSRWGPDAHPRPAHHVQLHKLGGRQRVVRLEKRVKGLKLRRKGKKKLRCYVRTKKRYRKLRRAFAKKYSGKPLARRLRKRRCKAYKKIGTIKKAVQPGLNTIVFTGRIRGRKLSKGTYRARLVITDLARNVSKTRTVPFSAWSRRKRRRKRRRASPQTGDNPGR